MRISIYDPPRHCEEALLHANETCKPPFRLPEKLRTALSNLSAVRNSVTMRAHVSSDTDAHQTGGPLSDRFKKAWPLSKKLHVSVRYQFGSHPCFYNELLAVARTFEANVSDCQPALKALAARHNITAHEKELLLKLLSACKCLDKQYETWETLIRVSKDPMLVDRQRQVGEAIANPFIGMRYEVARLCDELQRSVAPSVLPTSMLCNYLSTAKPAIVMTTDNLNRNT